MSHSELVERLKSHANLPRSDTSVAGISMAVRRWSRKREGLVVVDYVIDVVATLQALNSAAIGGQLLEIDEWRSAVYAMSCVLSELASSIRSDAAAEDGAMKTDLECALDVLAHAWSQFLAGDIEDIVADIHENSLWPSSWPSY